MKGEALLPGTTPSVAVSEAGECLLWGRLWRQVRKRFRRACRHGNAQVLPRPQAVALYG